jgi:putative two-component system response regulator
VNRQTIISRVLARPADVSDSSSGLHREPYFQAIFAMEMARVRRSGEPLTVGILGAENRSPAGGAPDAPPGERVFGEVGTLIKRHIRELDIATHSGDGLFPLILSRTNAELARKAGERIRVAIETASGGQTTVSVGLASFPEDGLDEEGVVARAADAFLHAVDEGGNRVFCFERKQRQAPGGKARILLVDDDTRNLKLLEAQISSLGEEILTATSGDKALDVVRGVDVDLVILDVMMPGLSGFETCRRIKSNEATRQVPVILLTALDDVESRLKGIDSGADDFISKPANKEELLARTRSLLRVKRLNRSLVSLENALISLANAVEAKDNYTLGHTQRVSTLAVALGANMGLDEGELQALRLGGILHDVGKIGVPEEILNKPGPLSDDEWKLMKSHAEMGYNICLPLMESIGPALDVIRHHHEKLDGSSYPDGLKGDEISRMARIMAVVDCYDAMITDRPYRAGMPKGKALAVLRDEVTRGKLDGMVVDALESLVTDRRRE